MGRLMFAYRPWWLLLDGARLLVRAAVEARRKSLVWPIGMTLRWATHMIIASPWLALWALTLVTAPARVTLVYGAAACAVLELVVAAVRPFGALAGFWTFRRAVTVHKRWPRSWGDYAGRTRRVQAETGAEPSTPVRWRPLVDHPRLSWLFWPTAPGVVEFLVGPPPDRTYADLVTATAAMAAKFSYIDALEVDYTSDRASLAVITIRFTGRHPGPGPDRALTLIDPNPAGGELVA